MALRVQLLFFFAGLRDFSILTPTKEQCVGFAGIHDIGVVPRASTTLFGHISRKRLPKTSTA
jgi:hypothetical protein